MPPQTESTHFQCRHIKPDGHRCGSPSLRHEHFCYYHHTARRPGPRQPQVLTAAARKSSTFQLPSPADLSERSGVGLALGLILHKIANNEIDARRAGLLLYGLQIASVNLRREGTKTGAKTSPVEEVADDPIYGLLAPAAEVGENEPKGVIQLLLEQLERESESRLATIQAPETSTVTTMQAAVAPRRSQCHRQRQRSHGATPLPSEIAIPPATPGPQSIDEPRNSTPNPQCRKTLPQKPQGRPRTNEPETGTSATLERTPTKGLAHGSRQPTSL